jgi:hypothetical protein
MRPSFISLLPRQRIAFIAVLAVVVVVGFISQLYTHATTGSVVFEAENGSVSGAQLGSDAQASGGKYVSFGSVVYGTTDHPFAASSFWNTPIASGAALDAQTSAIEAHVLTNPNLVLNLDLYSFGFPIYTATATTPKVQVTGMASGDNPVPLDPSWLPNAGSDGKINVFDPTTQKVWELDAYNPTNHSVLWGVSHNYVSELGNGYPPADQYHRSPNGAGVSQIGGLIRLSDIKSGSIDHALTFVTSNPTVTSFRYPASKTDGGYTGSDGIWEGMQVQLDPTLNVDAIAGITPGEKMIAKALQKYGAFCVDTGGGNNQAMGFYAETPVNGATDPYPAAGFTSDWALLPHIPRDRLHVLAATPTPKQ